jgi:hypothetical protein
MEMVAGEHAANCFDRIGVDGCIPHDLALVSAGLFVLEVERSEDESGD